MPKKYETEEIRKKKRLESRRKYNESHREEARKRQKEYYEKNKDRLRKEARERYKKKRYDLAKYNLTVEDYKKMVEEQNGECYICGPHAVKYKSDNLCVDHNHESGEVRKLLCDRCNTMIGLAKEDSTILKSAARYVDNYKPWWKKDEGCIYSRTV